MNINVPKFTSFKPKPKVTPTEPTQSPPSQREKSSKRKSQKEEQDRIDASESKRRRRSSRERETEQPKDKHRKTSRTSTSAHHDTTSDLFFIDRRGDRDIERYGTLNRYEIPRYRSRGYGYVLGLPLDRKINRELSTEKMVVITPVGGSRQKRLLTAKNVLEKDARKTKFVKVAAEEGSLDADFIALSRTSERARDDYDDGNDGGGEEDVEDTIADYRRLDGGPSDSKPPNPDAEYESDTVDTANPEVTQRNATLVRQTREHPEDIDGWIDLAEHQKAMMLIDRPSAELTLPDKHRLAEIRVSIYEQALHKSGKSAENYPKLYAGLMSEASMLWDVQRRANKWDEILAMYPLNTELWRQYLDDVQSGFTGFTYRKCRDAFLKCLKALRSTNGQIQSKFMLHILVRLTCMTHQAGYRELAIGTWQAILEFHLLKPHPAPENLVDVNMSLFEEFWDSEIARVGDAGATGWHKFDHDNPPSYLERTMEWEEDENVFSVVLFSDVEEVLKLIPQDISPTCLLNAFLCFCQMPSIVQEENTESYQLDPFLQQTFAQPFNAEQADTFTSILDRYSSCPLQKYQVTTEILFTRAFPEKSLVVEPDFLRRVFYLLNANNKVDEFIGVYLLAFESKYFPSEAFKTAKRLLKARPTSLYLYNAYALVESKRGNFSKADQVYSAALSMQPQQADQQLLSVPGSLDLFENWVWEALRKGDRFSALWRLTSPTGQLAATSANKDETPSQTTVLRTRTLLSDITSRSLITGDYNRAVMSTSLSALLVYLSPGLLSSSASQSSTIHAALSVHSTLTRHFTTHPNPSGQELHAQSIAALLTHHAVHAYSHLSSSSSAEQQRTERAVVKPSLLRETLEPLLHSFPSNTILLALYAANEARFALNDRVRTLLTSPSRMLDKSLAQQSTNDIVTSAFAIHHEYLRALAIARAAALESTSTLTSTSTSNPGPGPTPPQPQSHPDPQPHAIRALYTTMATRFPHCPGLRKAHTSFELTHFLALKAAAAASFRRTGRRPRPGTARPSKEDKKRLREVFVSGLTGLPWCQDYMELGYKVHAAFAPEPGRKTVRSAVDDEEGFFWGKAGAPRDLGEDELGEEDNLTAVVKKVMAEKELAGGMV